MDGGTYMKKLFSVLFVCLALLFTISTVSISCSDDTFDDGIPDSDSDSDNDTDSDSDSDTDSDTYDESWSCLICG
jgi:hypothetical protein